MSTIKAGMAFPGDVHFRQVEYQPDRDAMTACGLAAPYDAGSAFTNKTVVLIGIPGAFTPTCTEKHVPPYIERLGVLKAHGVDVVAVIAHNDAHVMNAYRKAHGVKDEMLFFSDPGCAFSRRLGFTSGERARRYAIIIQEGKVAYAEAESDAADVTVSGVEAVLSKLAP